MRLFLGFSAGGAERNIYELCQRLSAPGALLPQPTLRWVPAENWHVTLAFLGEVATSRLANLTAALEPVAASFPPLQLRLDHLQWFPAPTRARMLVLAASTADASDPLHELQRQLVQALRVEGFHTERRAYRPHLTLARLRGAHKQFTPAPLPEIAPLSLELAGLTLFESISTRGAPVYEPLQHFGLAA